MSLYRTNAPPPLEPSLARLCKCEACREQLDRSRRRRERWAETWRSARSIAAVAGVLFGVAALIVGIIALIAWDESCHADCYRDHEQVHLSCTTDKTGTHCSAYTQTVCDERYHAGWQTIRKAGAR